MYSTRGIYYEYKKARKKFSLKTYLLFLLWLLLALAQWLMVCFVDAMQSIFKEYFYISIVCFLIGVLFFALFLFFEKLRFKKAVAFLISIIIVELQIIAVFVLVVRSFWMEVLLYFAICVILIFIFVGIGIALPRKLDLTLHVALLFIMAFIFLTVAVFFLMLHLVVTELTPYAYILVQLPITITMLFFVMYHAQTIHGGRFAEMRLHDFLLASLILFHDFLIIYLLTFYWQVWARLVTPDNWPNNFQQNNTGQSAKYFDIVYDDMDTDSENEFNDMPKKIQRIKQREDADATQMQITLDFVRDYTEIKVYSNNFHDKDWPNMYIAEAKREDVYNYPESTTIPQDKNIYDKYSL